MSILKNFLDFAGLSAYDNKIKQIINSKVAKIKMNNNTLTPDSSGEINLGNIATTSVASDSADGLMSKEDYTRLKNVAAGAEVNVQSDWDQENTSADDFIKNKPTLGTASAKNYTTEVTSGSSDLVTSGGVYNAIDEIESVAETLVKDTVGWTGKNLVHYLYYYGSGTNVTVDIDNDGTFIFNGNPNNACPFVCSYPIEVPNNTTLKLIVKTLSGGDWHNDFYRALIFNHNSGVEIAGMDGTKDDASYSFNTGMNNTIEVRLYLYGLESMEDIKLQLMLTYDTTETSYIPFHPTVEELITPIPNKANKPASSIAGDIASLDTSGNLADSGVSMFGDKTYDFADVLEVKNALPVPAKSYAVKVKAKQDLHGHDKPWAGGTNINLYDCTIIESTAFDVTFSNVSDADGNKIGVKAKGLASNYAMYNVNCPLKAGTYKTFESKTSNNFSFNVRDANGSWFADPGTEFTLSEDTTIKIRYFVNSGVNADDIIYCMVYKYSGTDATAFSPYSNICPIIGKTKSTITRTGKNIWDEQYVQGDFSGITGEFVSGTYMCSKNLIPVKPNTAYTIWSTRANPGNYYYYEYDSNGNFVHYKGSGSLNGSSFITKPNTHFIHFQYGGTYGYPYTNDIIISMGDTHPTDYEPYNGITPEVNFPHTVCDGEFDSDGNLRDDDGFVVLDGSDDEDWGYYDGVFYCNFSNAKLSQVAPISNWLKGVSNRDYSLLNDGEFSFTANAGNANFKKSDITNLADWKIYLASNPLQVCYKLATPTTTQITAPDVPLLKDDNVISADSGQMKMTVGGMADAFEPKADKVTNATSGNLAGLDANGNLTDSGVSPTEDVTVEGNPVEFESPFEQDAKSVVVSVKPIQAGSGTPSPDNIRPISGIDEVEIEVSGKNRGILDASHIQSTYGQQNSTVTYANNGVIVTSTGNYGRCGFEVPVQKGKTYTISMKAKKSDSTGGGGILYGSSPMWDAEYGAVRDNGMSTSFTTLTKTITAESDTLYIGIYPLISGVSLTVEDFMVEVGEQATDFVPFKGLTETTIPLPSTLYDADVDVTNGSGTDNFIIETFDGSNDEVWEEDASHVYSVKLNGVLQAWKSDVECVSNEFEYKGTTIGASYMPNAGLYLWYNPNMQEPSTRYVMIRNNDMSLAELKAYLAEHPLQVCYELATPTTIPLTPTDVELLEGTNVVSTNGEKVAVTYKAGILATLGDIDDLNDKVKTKFDKKDVAKVEGTNASKPYAVGDYMLRSDGFYVVTQTIAQNAPITSNNTEKTTIGNELSNKADSDIDGDMRPITSNAVHDIKQSLLNKIPNYPIEWFDFTQDIVYNENITFGTEYTFTIPTTSSSYYYLQNSKLLWMAYKLPSDQQDNRGRSNYAVVNVWGGTDSRNFVMATFFDIDDDGNMFYVKIYDYHYETNQFKLKADYVNGYTPSSPMSLLINYIRQSPERWR